MICKKARRRRRHLQRYSALRVCDTAPVQIEDSWRSGSLFRAVLPALAVGVLAAACSGGGGGNDACGVTAQKEWVLATTGDWYYFDDLLPASVDLAQFPTAAELLDELTATAREQGKDRFFSFLTTRDEDSALLG